MKRTVLFIGLLFVAVGLLAQTAIGPTQGDGSAENPFQISTWQHLYWISFFPDVWNDHFIQTADIDLSNLAEPITSWNNDTGWFPIGSSSDKFTGSYNGNGKTINGLYINRSGSQYQGLFGIISNASISNLSIINEHINGSFATGGLVGYCEQSTIVNCSSSGSVYCYNVNSGGLVGINENSNIESCNNACNVSGTTICGGLVGLNNGSLSNCYSTGTIDTDYNTGGLIGLNYKTVTQCYNTGIVSGIENIGGLIGVNINGSINNCHSAGFTNGNLNSGGCIGYNSGDLSSCYNTGNVSSTCALNSGGLVGTHASGIINSCYNTGNVSGAVDIGGLVGYNLSIVKCSYNTGNVTSRSSNTGGLIGFNESNNDNSVYVSNCYNRGSVTGISFTGGVVGQNYHTINNCYSTGIVAGSTYTGGLVGDNDNGTISNSFWDIETSGYTNSDGGSGKTTAEMKAQSTYTDEGWNFSTIWAMDLTINDGYPYLAYPNSLFNNDNIIIPSTTAFLHAAYPNPFNPSTTLSFDVPNSEKISINIYNVKGQLVKNICNQVYDKGYHSIIWNGKDNNGTQCGTGVYFYKMQAGKTTQTQKMMMIK